MQRKNATMDPHNTAPNPILLKSVSDKLTRIRFLDQSDGQQQAARRRLEAVARPDNDAWRLLQRGLYAPGQPGELERLRDELGGLV